ncbi:aspartate-semialdehyde dehydrogenase [Burkholderia cenocepacia]|uniref:aspartate-semialdehyde dehydrogenase n=1 Tax=Burkholderia cenocepacia TaxID=95486 RepID=UPI00264AF62A|nr:aspartate-semialdehyde dehydrogenase [Burkholderia cenocepacia]MDN7456419.1 aspartate-semialdehyde dehydrogenase [Burkholderia cenocepacia]
MTQYRAPAAVADALLAHCKRYDYAGHDPFDGLNSRLFRYSGLSRLPLASIAWLQFHKRSPINLRRLVGVPRRRNPKGIALMVLGHLERERRIGDGRSVAEASELGDWLLGQRVDRERWQHSAWGYHFDWAARAFFVPDGTPNAITTCYVARALYALGKATGEARFVDAAVDAGYFLDSLYTAYEDSGYYAYIPGETAFVHNANLWVAAFVAETARRSDSVAMRDRALNAAELSVSMQRDDGAWAYGLRSHHGFIDGFHTGYNLEALWLLQRSANTNRFSDAISRGLEYYRNTFFLADGTVKYYDTNVWPIDMHSVAQALITLLTVSGTEDDRMLAARVYARAMQMLYLPDERRFAYQRTARFLNRVDYLRWTQAWAFYSIEILANNESGQFKPDIPVSE